MQKALEAAEFSENDILVIIGDIIEKGPESLKTLRFIMNLNQQGNVIPLLGNVDGWRLHMINGIDRHNADEFMDYLNDMREWFGTSFFDEMTAELGLVCKSADDVLSVKDEVLLHFEKEFSFLASLPTIVETQKYIFVHGGLPDNNLDNLEHYSLFDFLKLDHFMSNGFHFKKYVVVGHWPVALYCDHFSNASPIINSRQKIISIDGGCGLKSNGQLNLLILPHADCQADEIKPIHYDDFPVYTALSDQTASTDSIYITWLDNQITVLKKEKDFTYVRHISTDNQLWAPNDYVIQNGTRLNDYSNYALPVEKGDKLSLIKKTSKGCIVKKAGVTGWYYGDLQ